VQPHDNETKLEQARAYERRDAIAWPIAVDDVDGDVHRQLSPVPDAAYVVDTDGVVAYRALWANDIRPLRRAVAAVANGYRGRIGENESKLAAMLSGMGSMTDTLAAAGPVAVRDFSRELPPVWAMARFAHLFSPLPASWKGVAAVASAALLPIAAVAAQRRFSR